MIFSYAYYTLGIPLLGVPNPFPLNQVHDDHGASQTDFHPLIATHLPSATSVDEHRLQGPENVLILLMLVLTHDIMCRNPRNCGSMEYLASCRIYIINGRMLADWLWLWSCLSCFCLCVCFSAWFWLFLLL